MDAVVVVLAVEVFAVAHVAPCGVSWRVLAVFSVTRKLNKPKSFKILILVVVLRSAPVCSESCLMCGRKYNINTVMTLDLVLLPCLSN